MYLKLVLKSGMRNDCEKNGPLILIRSISTSLILWEKTSYRKHPQISWNLNLAAQIFQKNFFQRNQDKYEVKSLALFQMCMREIFVTG